MRGSDNVGKQKNGRMEPQTPSMSGHRLDSAAPSAPIVLQINVEMIDKWLMGTDFSAGFGADFERGFELAPLGRGEDRPRPLGSPSAVVARPAVIIQRRIVA